MVSRHAENIYHLSRSSSFAELWTPLPLPSILKEKTRIYYFYGTPILLRDGIMEIYVSGNCKFALLATIIDERIFFLYFVWKHYFSFSLSERKEDGNFLVI